VLAGVFLVERGMMLDGLNDVAEDSTNSGAKQGQDNNNDDSNQYEDQRVLYQTLSFFFRGE
jgi:hypothetical protein